MAIYLVNLGSNLGDRRLNLSRAMRAIGDEFGPFDMSHVVETDAQGFTSNNKFLNLGMMFHSDLEPEEVLDKLQAIERTISPASHRDAKGNYVDRRIDIDIVAIDDRVIDTERLKVPHPRLAERLFFLAPLDEIAGAWRHPVTGLTAAEMAEKLIEK